MDFCKKNKCLDVRVHKQFVFFQHELMSLAKSTNS